MIRGMVRLEARDKAAVSDMLVRMRARAPGIDLMFIHSYFN